MQNRMLKKLTVVLAAMIAVLSPIGNSAVFKDPAAVAEAAGTGFAVSTKSAKIMKGKTLSLKTTGAGKETIKWTSSNKKVATVTAKGTRGKNCIVKAVGTGTATITGRTANNKKVTCKVTVYEGKFSKKSIKIELGRETAALKFTGGSGKETWKLANKKVAALTRKSAHVYKITGLKPGKVNVIVTDGKNKYKCLITVVKPGTLKTVKTSSVRSFNFDDTTSFKITNDSSLKVTWKVSSGNSVKITSSSNTSCTVRGIAPGKSSIEAFCDDMNKKWVWDVNVNAVSKPYFTQNPLVLTVGDHAEVPLAGVVSSVKPEYDMNNSDAILLTASGKITACRVGTAKVTVVADGVTLELDVVVKAKEETKPTETEKQPESETEKKPAETENQPETEKPKETEDGKQTETESETTPADPKEPETDPDAEEKPGELGKKLKYTYDLDWSTNASGIQVNNVELEGGEEYYFTIKSNAPSEEVASLASDMSFVSMSGLVDVTNPSVDTTPVGTKRIRGFVYGRKKGIDKIKIYAEGMNLIGELTVTVTSDDEYSKQYAAWFENVIKANTGFYDDSLTEMQKLVNCENYILHHFTYPEPYDGFHVRDEDNSFMLSGMGNCLEATNTMNYYAKELMKLPGSHITQVISCTVNVEGVLPTHIVSGIRIDGVLCGFDASPIRGVKDFSQIPERESYQYVESDLRAL